MRADRDRPADAGAPDLFAPRAAGATLLVYALFNAAFGLNRDELPWLISAGLLAIASLALIFAWRGARLIVLATALTAAVVGWFSQLRAANEVHLGTEDATLAWALWAVLWLATAHIGARYLPDPDGTPGSFRAE